MPRKTKKPLEAVRGAYAALPHTVLDSHAFIGASRAAQALLLGPVARQLNGRNNGRLQLTTRWLAERGWRSADTVRRAIDELIERRLLIMTKRGGLNMGASWYGVTWLPISNFVGFDSLLGVTPSTYHQGAYLLFRESDSSKAARHCSVRRNSTVPSEGTAKALTVPSDGTKRPQKNAMTVPWDGHTVLSHSRARLGGGGVDD
jgi:hypothetical protein